MLNSKMQIARELIFYSLRTFCPHLGSFFVVSSHYVLAKFHLWPSSGDYRDLG